MNYVYKLRNGSGSCPEITAVAMSGNAEVSITQKSVNETSFVICQSDRDKNTENYRTYRIYFEESTVNDGLTATERDVFIRRVAGACQLFVATIRKDVTFILYDQTGHMVNKVMIRKRREDKTPYDRRIVSLQLLHERNIFYDAQYFEDEYSKYKGYGHSTPEEGIRLKEESRAKELVFIHHSPAHNDLCLYEAERKYIQKGAHFAREGEVIVL